MKFTIVSHACIYIEHEDIRLLVDPWIIGSCYWRSWWNYPEVSSEILENINPTHIYLTHLHWDHFHGPSLRKFEYDNPTILLPKHFNKRMKQDITKDFKFTKIKELVHGRKYKLSNDFLLASYQFNPFIIDSALVVEAENTTLLNSNDSKIFGYSLKQLINNHPKIDFIFRSHSSASPIPQCIRGINVEETDRAPSDYADDFIAFSKATKTKYAIPFASSHIYLHKDTRKFNKYYSDPSFIKSQFDLKIKSDQKCLVMVSGSSWSKKNGFQLKSHDFSNLESDISNYTLKNLNKIEKQIRLESIQSLNKRAFENYFLKFLTATAFPIKLIKFRFAFLINEKKNANKLLCIVDGEKKSTEIIKISSEKDFYKYKLEFIIKTPIYVFNDCNLKSMHNSFTPSKLLEIIITSKNGEKKLLNYLNLVDLYENDCLPFLSLLTFRNIIIIFRRFREMFDTFLYILKIKIQNKKIHQLYSDL